MRSLAHVCILLVVFAAASPVFAQSSGGFEVVDTRGDVKRTTTLGSESVDAPHMDLLALNIAERPDGLEFVLQLASLAFEDDTEDRVNYEVAWQFEDIRYQLLVEREADVLAAEPSYEVFASRSVSDTTQRTELENVTLTVDDSNIRVVVPWNEIVDENGAKVSTGQRLEQVWVRALNATRLGGEAGESSITTMDLLPDLGRFTYPIARKGQESHGLTLRSDDPVRVSNGGPATFLFPITLVNLGEETAFGELRASQAPDEWIVTPLSPLYEIEPLVPLHTGIAVAAVGNHVHGGQDDIVVELVIGGQAQAEQVLSVVYTEVPQPAGHHPALYLHSDADEPRPDEQALEFHRGRLSMNTINDWEFDDAQPITETSEGGRKYWRAPLAPALAMGLDVAAHGQGRLEFRVEPNIPSDFSSVDFRAKLIHQLDSVETILMEGTATVSDLGNGGDASLMLEVLSGVGIVEYAEGANLILEIESIYDTTSGGFFSALNLMPGAFVELPLRDYQDPVPGNLGSPIELQTPEARKPIHAGGRTNFPISMTSAEDQEIKLDTIAVPPGWVIHLSQESVRGSGSIDVVVQVVAPHDAEDGETASFFLRAAGVEGQPAVLALRAYVDEDADLVQPAAFDEPEKGASGLWWGWILLAFLARRRLDAGVR